MKIRSTLYALARLLGHVNAASKGKVIGRLFNTLLGRLLNGVWKK